MNPIRTVALLLVTSLLAMAEEPEVAWSVDVKGEQIATPVVVKGVVYVVARRTPPPDGSSEGWLFAIDLESGKVKWSASTAGALQNPAVDSGVVCVLEGSVLLDGDSTKIVARDAETGETKWTVSAAGPSGTYFSPWAPAAAEGRAFFARGEELVAVDIKTGKELWVAPTPDRILGGPEARDGRVWGASERALVVFDASTGKELLRREGAVGAESGSGVFVVESVKSLEALDGATLKTRWTVDAPRLDSVILESELVEFIGKDRKLHGLDLATGRETRTTDAAGQIGGGRIVMAKGEEVTARGADGGALQWRWKPPASVVTAFTLRSGLICVGCADRKIYALREAGAK